jgi:hypothetical protein
MSMYPPGEGLRIPGFADPCVADMLDVAELRYSKEWISPITKETLRQIPLVISFKTSREHLKRQSFPVCENLEFAMMRGIRVW